MAEYEKTISELIAEKEKEQLKFEEEKAKMSSERDQVTQTMNAIFAIVHQANQTLYNSRL